MISTVRIALLFSVLAMSLYFDVKENKIKNYITVPAALAGFSLNFFQYGIYGLVSSSKGFVTPLVLLMIFYLINVMGAGDIKLFAAMGAIMGMPFVIYNIILSICIGAIIAFMLLIRRGQLIQKMKKVYYYFLTGFLSRRLIIYTDRGSKDSKFPFSVAIVPAVLIYLIITGNIKTY